MKYIIEFELPDNDTVLNNIGSAIVQWSVWGYSGWTHAKPVRHGRWIEFRNHDAYRCSECGRMIETIDGKNNVSKHYPYCHCGARMDGKDGNDGTD